MGSVEERDVQAFVGTDAPRNAADGGLLHDG